MATLPPVLYPLDPTGVSPNNVVSGEIHVMPPRQRRVIAPLYGGYYSQSMVVVEQSTNITLVKGTHYDCIELYPVPSAKYGKQVCGLVLITDPNISNTVKLTYQAVGGEYSKSLAALKQLIETLEVDARPAAWPQIIGKPEEFTPTQHLHDVGDVYGFETFVHGLYRIQRAIELGDTITHDAVFRYIDQVMLDHPDAVAVAALIATAVNNHVLAPNPHPQYQTTTPEVKKPALISPGSDEPLAGLTPRLIGSNYGSLYNVDHGGTQFQIATNNTFSAGLFNSPTLGPVTFYDVPAGTLLASTSYFARVRYISSEGTTSPWSDPQPFATGNAVVAQPSVLSPANGATNQSLTPTLTCSAFAMASGVDTHFSTEWEINSGVNGSGNVLWNSGLDAINRTSIAVPEGILIPSTGYHYRARHRGAASGVSAFSTSKLFTTAAAAPVIPPIGSLYGGGYVAGYFRIGVQKYVLVVAPKSLGEIAKIRHSQHYHNMPLNSQSTIDGQANTIAMLLANQTWPGRFPIADWAKARVIAGFADWYVPSRDEMELVYRNLKSDPYTNATGGRSDGNQMGVNAYSDPVGAAYTNVSPAQTAVTPFRQYGTEAFTASGQSYWTSTRAGSRDSSHEQVWQQRMAGSSNGQQPLDDAMSDAPLRIVRRVPVPG